MENPTYFQRTRILILKGFQTGGLIGTFSLILFASFFAFLNFGSEPPHDRISFLLVYPFIFELSMITFLIGIIFVCLVAGIFKHGISRLHSFLIGFISAIVATIGLNYFYYRILGELISSNSATFFEFMFSGVFGAEPFGVKLFTSPFLSSSIIIILTLSYVGWKLEDQKVVVSKKGVLKPAIIVSISCISLLCIPNFSFIEFLFVFFTVIAFVSAKSIKIITLLYKKELTNGFASALGAFVGFLSVLVFNLMAWVGIHNLPDRYFYSPSTHPFPFSRFIFPDGISNLRDFFMNINPIFIPSLFGLLISIYVGWRTNRTLQLDSALSEK